jgi:hypothetical protein
MKARGTSAKKRKKKIKEVYLFSIAAKIAISAHPGNKKVTLKLYKF